MPTTITWKPVIDVIRGRAIANPPLAWAALFSNPIVASDMRGRDYAQPFAYAFINANFCVAYNMKADAWMQTPAFQIISAGGAGRGSVHSVAPSQGPKGTLTTGNTTTKVVLSTALPATVLANQLADRGDGKGFIIRIIGNASGSSGKIEERRIIGNTSGTAPTIWVDEAFSFTPANGDAYEILSGRIFTIGTASITAGIFKYFDIATQSVSGNLSTTNMPSLSASAPTQIVMLDESYVPKDRFPGEGFMIGAATYDADSATYVKGCLTATATAAGTITGQASSGDATVVANEYRNFQIRIVEDTTTPTAVGQRRRITSHTAGASAVYTLASNWTVTPSSTAKFVIENDNDKFILWNTNQTTTYNYNHTANTWDTTTWAARATAHSQFGLAYHNFSMIRDTTNISRHSEIHSIRSGTTVDIFDISGGATGSWTNGIAMNNYSAAQNSTQGFNNNQASSVKIPFHGDGSNVLFRVGNQGSQNNFHHIYRYNMKSKSVQPICQDVPTYNTQGYAGMDTSAFTGTYYDAGTYVTAAYFLRPGDATNYYQYLILD